MAEAKYFTRRDVTASIAAGVVAALLPILALAETYPSRAITIIVPYGPGSYMDGVIRPFALALQKSLGQTIITENKGGANGIIGSQFAVRANHDGYTLLVGSTTTLAANSGLFKSLPYDPLKDFVPISGIASTSMMLMVRSDFQAQNLKSFLEYSDSLPKPVAIGYGSSSAQIALAQLIKVSGVKFMGVPYKATPQALTDLTGGQIPAAIVDVSNGIPHIKSGQLTALSITSETRSAAAPNVPTMGEMFQGVQLVTWIGLVALSNTPQAVLDKLRAAASDALNSPELKQQLATQATELEPMTAKEMGDRMRTDQVQWQELITAAGIEPK